MSPTFANGRSKGIPALTREEHEWLISAISSGLVTKIEAAAKLKISIPTVNAWLRRPVGYCRPIGGRPRKGNLEGKVGPGPDSTAAHADPAA